MRGPGSAAQWLAACRSTIVRSLPGAACRTRTARRPKGRSTAIARDPSDALPDDITSCRRTAALHPAAASATGWMRWLPGLQLLRHYPAAWWRHDLAAGLVLTTMLVPVGIAYAVASGVPGIHGLYATIAALLAYALFGPSRILVLGPGFVAGGADPGGGAAAVGRRSGARGGPGRRDGDCRRPDLHRRRPRETGLRHRTAVQADPLRLHERHRAGGHRQPVAQAAAASRIAADGPPAQAVACGAGAVGRAAQRRRPSASARRRWC